MQLHVDLKFANGEYRCALGLVQIEELQRATGAGIGELYARVLQGRLADQPNVGHPAYAAFRLSDVRETIRLGLVGGGQGIVDGQDVIVSPLRANELVATYLDVMPLVEQWNMAAAILYAVVEGYEPKEGEGDDEPTDDDKKKAPTTDSSTMQAH